MKTNSEIGFYVDTMIVETILSDDVLSKQAQAGGLLTSLTEKIKHYVGNHIDPKDKVGSLFNILGPSIITQTFKVMGAPGWFAYLIGLAMSVFHIDVTSIVSSIWDKLKESLSDGKQVTSSHVDGIVNGAVKSHSTPPTEDEATKGLAMLSKSFDQQMRDAKMLRLAMSEYKIYVEGQKKQYSKSDFLSSWGDQKTSTTSLLGRILSWIFKVALASAGLMVAGDVVNKFLDRPNAIDDTIQKGKPVATPAQAAPVPVVTSHQTKFKVNPSYKDEQKNVSSNWSESISNDEASIGSMLVMFAKQVYQGLDGLEGLIRTSPGFQVVKDRITFYNRTAAGDPVVFIPKYFTSKKQIVDMFIDDVAERAP